ncbi:MAG: cytochrome bc1 complex Rieske iron-sulfur subunit [Acidothermaceae bacterium]
MSEHHTSSGTHLTTPAIPVQGAEETGALRPPVVEPVTRPQDADPKRAKRAERIIALFFTLSAVGTIGFIAAYVAYHPINSTSETQKSDLWLGLSLGLTLAGLAAGIIAWVRWLMPAHETLQERHEMASSDDDLESAAQIVMTGYQETGLPRRSLLKRSLGLSLGLLALPPVVLLRDLGPLPRKSLRTTLWAKNSPLLNAETGDPVKLGDLEVGSFTTVVPKRVEDMSEEDYAKAPVLLIRLEPGINNPAPGRENWAYQDHVAYSKICTHVGCPVGLYQKQSHKLLCPCHQSTFLVPQACKVVFGPAARNLPQLPITVNDNGEFIATAGFDQPVGPSFWERG